MNRISDTKFFNFVNKKYNYNSKLSKINFKDYYIPSDLINDKLNNFKGYKYPLVTEIIEAVKSGKIIPCNFSESNNPKKINVNLHTDIKWPHAIFNLTGMDEKGNLIVMCDLSTKGKYQYAPTGELIFFNIPDIILFHMLMGAYITYKLESQPELSSNPSLVTKVAECYALINSKIIDNMFPIIQTSRTDWNKLQMILQSYCMEVMFDIPHDDAIKYALKSKLIQDKNAVMSESNFIMTNKDFTSSANYNDKFPIDILCDILCEEFPNFIKPTEFNANIFNMKFTQRMNKNSAFCLDHSISFIIMLLFGKASIGIYNDMLIKDYLSLASFDITKELAILCK